MSSHTTQYTYTSMRPSELPIEPFDTAGEAPEMKCKKTYMKSETGELMEGNRQMPRTIYVIDETGEKSGVRPEYSEIINAYKLHAVFTGVVIVLFLIWHVLFRQRLEMYLLPNVGIQGGSSKFGSRKYILLIIAVAVITFLYVLQSKNVL